MRTLLLAAGLLALNVGSAVAQDRIYDWSGAYVGVQAGYAVGQSLYTNTDFPGEYVNYDPDGFFGGVYAGYNFQMSNGVVLGVDGDLNFTNIKGSNDYWWLGLRPVPTASAEIKYTAALRARLGYAMGRFLPYVAGGLSAAKYDFDFVLDTGHVYYAESKSMVGWNVGLGAEYAATDNIVVRAEYAIPILAPKASRSRTSS
ncbi:outer membrane protein [Aminobacter sp. HY435]|uniref:outer membrane protein n=1 Tax=Aminobacter sp. HY435 TaxID=2970917 RepID=UPI0022B9B195|nr:outer membrane beta-barrel protein [Aminobacter sp. HY435]